MVEAGDITEVTITDAIMISKTIRTDTGQIVETEDSTDRTEVALDMNKIIGEEISEVIREALRDKIAGESIELITGMKVMTEDTTDLEKGHFPETTAATEIGV